MIDTIKYSYSHTLQSSNAAIVVDNPPFLDRSIGELDHKETYPHNLRVYAALDINPEAILRRLDYILWKIKEVGDRIGIKAYIVEREYDYKGGDIYGCVAEDLAALKEI